VDEPYNPVLSSVLGNVYYFLGKYTLSKVEFDKAIEYYQGLADNVRYINPGLARHQEIYGQLAKNYNNRGVVNNVLFQQTRVPDYEQKSLLDFYRAKDNMNKINRVYNFAEYNIKYILNRNIRNTKPVFDEEIVKRTTLQKLIEEFKANMITSL
jgi:hypothetical protein